MTYQNILITGGAGFVGSNLAIRIKTWYPEAHVLAADNLRRSGSEVNLPRLRAHVTPFGAIGLRDSMNASTAIGIPTVVLPGLICGGIALWAVYKREWDVKIWTLLVVTVFSVVTLSLKFNRGPFLMLRVSSGLVLAAPY
jgi:hypothetical protein